MTQEKKLSNSLMTMLKICLKVFMNKKKEGSGLKILTLKQMLKRFPIALAQIKADNNSESLLSEIR